MRWQQFGFSRIWQRLTSIVALSAGVLVPVTTLFASTQSFVAATACRAMSERFDALAGAMPLFLRSYDHERGSGEPEEPALRTAAFTYDNALAVIALLGC